MLTNHQIAKPSAERPPIRSHFSLLWVLLILTIGCSKPADVPASAESTPSQESSAKSVSTPTKAIDRKHPVVRIVTNLGEIELRLDAEQARGTVQNFLNYVNEGFYKDTIFHFVVADKMILGGGYKSDYQLKPTHGPIRNEAHNGRKNVRGTIAMARDPALVDSANSQFFINLEDAPQRDYQGDTPESYGNCVFGEVIRGLDVVEKISKSATIDMSAKGGDLAATPRTPVIITSIQVVM